MAEVIGYRIQQIVDNGHAVQMTLAEDVQTEPAGEGSRKTFTRKR